MAETTTQGATYICAVCESVFRVFRLGVVRCNTCGSLDTSEIDVQEAPEATQEAPQEATQRARTLPLGDLTSAYACPGCAARFEWNHTKMGTRSPVCPRCASSKVIERSPRVRVIVLPKGSVAALQADQALPTRRIMTAREAKRWRFITRNWKMRCELKQWLDGLDNLLTRLRVDGPRAQAMKRDVGALLAEVDAEQKAALEQYNALVAAGR